MKQLFFATTLTFMLVNSLLGQNRTITGKITNPAGEPLPGATVLVKDTQIGTTSDENGTYHLSVPETYNVLVFSFLGFLAREVEINGSNKIDALLEESASELNQVIVIGFGTQSKRRVTSAIASVGEEAFKNVPVTDFQNALAGRMSGVVMSGSSGVSNSDVNIRIRGTGSISAGNQPLIVVDGLILSGRINAPYYNEQYAEYNTNPFINMNPNDIESVEVLKDAAASAIYGSRGANGVILITTKSGKFDSQPKVSIGYYAGFTEISKKFEVMNGKEYAAYWNHAALNSGYTPENDPDMFYDVDAQPSSDWQDLGTRRGLLNEVNANVAGGSKSTKYYFSGTMRDENGYLLTDHSKRISLRANIDQMLGEKVTVGININPSRVQGQRPNNRQSPTYQSWYIPNIEAFDESGESRKDIPETSTGYSMGWQTPLTNLLTEWISITSTQLLANTYLSYSPFSWLTLRTEFASELTQLEELYKNGVDSWYGYPSGWGSAYNQQTDNFNWTALATYHNSFKGKHDLNASIGFNLTRESLTGLYVDGVSFADDRLKYLGAAAQFTTHITSQTDAAFVGYLARLNYAFENKYLLTLSARYDGSSRFGAENRFGFFPAVSAGWIVSEEGFFKQGLINYLKIRSSFGVAGNAKIGDFASQGLVQFGQNYLDQPGLSLSSIENGALGWEKNVQWDAGVEFALLNNRIRGTLEYYIKDTRDLLLQVPIPSSNGYRFITQNVGEVRNQGFEFDLTTDILTGKFGWSIAVNGATLKNEVRKLVDNNGDGIDDDIRTFDRFLFRTGEPIGTFFMPEYAGVDPDNGDALFWDADRKEKVFNLVTDANRRIVGKALPDFTGGFTNSFRYGNFDLAVFFQFKTGFQVYRQQAHLNEQNMNSGYNQAKSQLNSWRPDNRNTNVPEARLFQQNGDQRWTSRRLSDADFMRLKNTQLGYTLKGLGARAVNLRIYAAGQNLLTFTKFPDPDPDASEIGAERPEQGSGLGTPPATRTIIFGVNLNF